MFVSRCSRLSLLVFLLLASGLRAQPEALQLRWRFTPGDTFRLRMTQNVQNATTVGEKTTTANVTTALELTWRVESVQADGSARVLQSFDRMYMKGTGPDGESTTYDSLAPGHASEEAKAKAWQLAPLRGSGFLITLDGRGQVLGVEMTSETKSRLSDPESRELAQRMVTTSFVEGLMRPSLGMLPQEPVAVGDRWSITRHVESLTGRTEVTDHYRLEGVTQVDGRTLARIRLAIRARAEDSDEVTEPGGGEFQFDCDAGRLVSSQLKGSLSHQTPYRETSIEVRTTSATKLRIDLQAR